MLQNNTAAANAFNAQQSQKQMDFQVAQNAKAMEFNSRQAELNRNWQEMMSNTSHQREVQDLIAAGLNPVLSAMGGSGASVGAGSAASVAGTQGSKAEADTSINAGLAGILSSLISGQTQRDVANINAAASMHNAELTSDATKYAANTSYAGLMQQLSHMEEWPTTLFGTLASVIHGLGEGFGSIGEAINGFSWPELIFDFGSGQGSTSSGEIVEKVKPEITKYIQDAKDQIKKSGSSIEVPTAGSLGPNMNPFKMIFKAWREDQKGKK